MCSHRLWRVSSIGQNSRNWDTRTTNRFFESNNYCTFIVRDNIPPSPLSHTDPTYSLPNHNTLRELPRDPTDITMPGDANTVIRFSHYTAPRRSMDIVINFIEHARNNLVARLHQHRANWLDDLPNCIFAYQDENKIRIQIRSLPPTCISYLYAKQLMQGLEKWTEKWSEWVTGVPATNIYSHSTQSTLQVSGKLVYLLT